MANQTYKSGKASTDAAEEMAENEQSAKSLYSSLETQRFTFLRRAREASELTIPTLVPPQGHSYATIYPTPYQSIGARGVNNLASKLLLALLPPNSPFFRLAVDEYQLQRDAAKAGNQIPSSKLEEMKTEMEKALSKVERVVMREIETSSLRVGVYEALRQLIVAGNVLIHLPEDSGMRVFRIDTYGVKRDPSGNVTHIVVKERIAEAALPKYIKDYLENEEDTSGEDDDTNGNSEGYDGMDGFVEIFTKICREEDEDGWEVYQEINDKIIPESMGTYPDDKLPWLALRFNRIDGEDYGRGFVEEYLGDLKSLEALSKAVVEATAAASKVVFLVDPTGTTRTKTLAEAENGSFISGKATDVTALQVEKRADLSIVNQVINDISSRLSFAFLLNTAIQRNAERVTAEEIRYMAQELETSLGGAYSILSQEFQLPLVTQLLDRMAKAKKLPKMPKELVKPLIVTGVEALGRGNDLQKLDLFIQGIVQNIGQEALQYINPSEYLNRRAAALGIDSEGLIRTPDEIAQQTQQAQQMEMAKHLGPAGLQAGAKLMTDPNVRQSVQQNIAGQAPQDQPSPEQPPAQ